MVTLLASPYGSNLQLLKSFSYSVDPYMGLITLPATGTYYLRVAGQGASTGPYKLFVNFLPSEVSYFWLSPTTPGGSGRSIDDLVFSNGGNNLYVSQYQNYLSLLRLTGTPGSVYTLASREVDCMQPMAASRDGSVLVGGRRFLSDEGTWTYNATDWTHEMPASGPGRLDGCCMAYDEARGVSILFGGIKEDGSYSDETCRWDGGSWSHRSVGSPTNYDCLGLAFDTRRNVSQARVPVLYHGSSPNAVLRGIQQHRSFDLDRKQPLSVQD